MYPIITEERQLDDHKTLYSAFGAKLEPIGDLSTPLDSFSQLKDIVLKNIFRVQIRFPNFFRKDGLSDLFPRKTAPSDLPTG